MIWSVNGLVMYQFLSPLLRYCCRITISFMLYLNKEMHGQELWITLLSYLLCQNVCACWHGCMNQSVPIICNSTMLNHFYPIMFSNAWNKCSQGPICTVLHSQLNISYMFVLFSYLILAFFMTFSIVKAWCYFQLQMFGTDDVPFKWSLFRSFSHIGTLM